MPQSNPTIPLGKASEIFSQGLATGDFELVPGETDEWFIRKTFTIPPEFTAIEFVFHIRSIDGTISPVIYWYSKMTPDDDTVTQFDNQKLTLPSALNGGVPGTYPGMIKMGIGPIFQGLVTNNSGGDVINQPNFVPFLQFIGINVYIVTTISTPIQMIFTLTQTPAGTPPSLDATVYYTFYK